MLAHKDEVGGIRLLNFGMPYMRPLWRKLISVTLWSAVNMYNLYENNVKSPPIKVKFPWFSGTTVGY